MWRPLALVLIALGAAKCEKIAVVPPVSFHTDVGGAFATARAQNKPVVVFVQADWDCGSKMLEQETFADPEVRLLLGHDFVPIRLDATDDESPETRLNQERFRVIGVPTIILYDPDGRTELARFNSYIEAKDLRPMLAAAERRDGGEAIRRLVAARDADLQRRFAAANQPHAP